MDTYVPLHQHSFYSHDGGCFVEEIAQFCADQGLPACALTDHARVDGMVKFSKACYGHGVKPLIGVEAYYQPVFQPEKGALYYHFGFIAKNQNGYENLMQMLSDASEKYYYGRAMVTYELLEKYHDDIIILSGCISSYPARKFIAGEIEDALQHIQDMQGLCGEDYYLELQPFPVYFDAEKYPNWENRDIQKEYNDWLLLVSEYLGIRCVMTADSHFVDVNKLDTHLMAQKLRMKTDTLADYTMRYMHSYQSMLGAWLAQMGEKNRRVGEKSLRETVSIAMQCDELLKEPLPVDMPSLEWIGDEGDQARRFLALVKLALLAKGKHVSEEYVRKAQEELNVIVSKGFAGYFIMIEDFVRWCKEKDIIVHARGSVCGSLLAYLLDFHTIDPLKWPIVSFSRFIGDRKDLPDIDIDMPGDISNGIGPRSDALRYISEKYQGNTALISTYGRWTTKNLLAAMIKATVMQEHDENHIRKSLEAYHFSDADLPVYQNLVDGDAYLREFDQKYNGFVRIFCQLYGSVNFVGTHPAGVIIASPNIRKRVAINRVKGKLQVACDMDDVSYLGLVKFDILGVDNLAVIQFAEKDAGISFDEKMYWEPDVLESFGRGRTSGIFQFGRRQAQQMCREAYPITSPVDVAILTACNRPEPLKEGSYREWIDRKRQPYKGGLPWEDEYTRGAWIFQEQAMELCRYAGFTQSMVDKMLKMLKRYRENDVELEEAFVLGMRVHGYNDEKSHAMWENMRRYLFNAAHAASYAAHAIRQKRLKDKYKYSWYLALMTFEDDKEKREEYKAEALRREVYFAPAHVNGSAGFGKIEMGKRMFIQYGLQAIHGVGEKAAHAIINNKLENGLYTSTEDFVARMSVKYSKVNAAAREAIIAAGAAEFDAMAIKQNIVMLNRRNDDS